MLCKAFVLALLTLPNAAHSDGVRYRGIFVNDEDWGLRPWAVRHFGEEEQIGTNAYAEIFALMKRDGLNLIWPAMHEGGYEFSARPENLELARRWGITVGTSHCEPMLRNNCYLPKADKKKWSWVSNRDFLVDYWREGVRRGMGNGEWGILWTIGMRGIHDGRMPDGKTTEEKIKILEEVFAAQCAMLPDGASKLFCPYKEVLPIFNAGLKVPDDATILWVNDNFGYVRRVGGDHVIHGAHGRQGIYWHLSYWGRPHGYIHLCTTPPAFMWYELVAKCWNNGVRDVWIVNAGDVFQAEILLDAFGKFAAEPESWGADAQARFLSSWADGFLAAKGATTNNLKFASGYTLTAGEESHAATGAADVSDLTVYIANPAAVGSFTVVKAGSVTGTATLAFPEGTSEKVKNRWSLKSVNGRLKASSTSPFVITFL